MPLRRRYRPPHVEAFAALLRRHELAGFACVPLPPFEVIDLYLDTASAGLLREGCTLRLRVRGRSGVLSLRRLADGGGELARALWEGGTPAPGTSVDLPEGELRETVAARAGAAPLQALLRLRQYRTPRALYDGERFVGALSLDVVSDETDPADVLAFHEVETEVVPSGGGDDLERIDAALRSMGFEPERLGKLEAGIVRRGRRANGPLLLLPEERERLQRLRDEGTPVERRRAEAVLRTSEGEDPEAIAARVGLGAARVRHWARAFRRARLHAFDPTVPEPDLPKPPPRTFRVTELLEVEEEAGGAPPLPPGVLDAASEDPPPPVPAEALAAALRAHAATLRGLGGADDAARGIDALDRVAGLTSLCDAPEAEMLRSDLAALRPRLEGAAGLRKALAWLDETADPGAPSEAVATARTMWRAEARRASLAPGDLQELASRLEALAQAGPAPDVLACRYAPAAWALYGRLAARPSAADAAALGALLALVPETTACEVLDTLAEAARALETAHGAAERMDRLLHDWIGPAGASGAEILEQARERARAAAAEAEELLARATAELRTPAFRRRLAQASATM